MHKGRIRFHNSGLGPDPTGFLYNKNKTNIYDPHPNLLIHATLTLNCNCNEQIVKTQENTWNKTELTHKI